MASTTLISIAALVLVTLGCCLIYSDRLTLMTFTNSFPKIGNRKRIKKDFRDSKQNSIFPPEDLMSNDWMNLTESRPFSNYGDGTCAESGYGRELKKIFIEWIKITKVYKVLYFLNFGTLLGAWRAGDLIPTDSDIDLVVSIHDTEKLLKYGKRNGFNLYIQKDWKLPEEHRRRFNCEGKQVSSQVDSCAFVEPIGRLIEISSGLRLDIYSYDMLYDTVRVFSDYHQELRKDFVFPLKKCKFMGLESYCPNKPKPILTIYYGVDLKPNEICQNTKWIKNVI
ncbi:uncharacterized protein [Clytia hemisphaerica]|uniref:LicD/FKTN/FKRP nucleotidyltransferase domain-containing protein n=1 Tax=Clytia hemisphaerica TaxID=252671 RepID=A0A7M5XCC7_9CNID|eukprot:TCONS_00003832-protein